MPDQSVASPSRRIEQVCTVLGAALLAWCGVVFARATFYQSSESWLFDRMRGDPPASRAVTRGRPIGRLDIPRLRLSVMVAEGDEEDTLQMAIGHLPDTPLPWDMGNSALAGHRDTFFRPLKNARVKDKIHLATTHGDFEYEVTRVRVVDPDDVSVLASGDRRMLTLVTCYPFSYVGSAPKRFVLQAIGVGNGPGS